MCSSREPLSLLRAAPPGAAARRWEPHAFPHGKPRRPSPATPPAQGQAPEVSPAPVRAAGQAARGGGECEPENQLTCTALPEDSGGGALLQTSGALEGRSASVAKGGVREERCQHCPLARRRQAARRRGAPGSCSGQAQRSVRFGSAALRLGLCTGRKTRQVKRRGYNPLGGVSLVRLRGVTVTGSQVCCLGNKPRASVDQDVNPPTGIGQSWFIFPFLEDES